MRILLLWIAAAVAFVIDGLLGHFGLGAQLAFAPILFVAVFTAGWFTLEKIYYG